MIDILNIFDEFIDGQGILCDLNRPNIGKTWRSLFHDLI